MHTEQETVLFFDTMNLFKHSFEQNLNKIFVLLNIWNSFVNEEFNLQKHTLHISVNKYLLFILVLNYVKCINDINIW